MWTIWWIACDHCLWKFKNRFQTAVDCWVNGDQIADGHKPRISVNWPSFVHVFCIRPTNRYLSVDLLKLCVFIELANWNEEVNELNGIFDAILTDNCIDLECKTKKKKSKLVLDGKERTECGAVTWLMRNPMFWHCGSVPFTHVILSPRIVFTSASVFDATWPFWNIPAAYRPCTVKRNVFASVKSKIKLKFTIHSMDVCAWIRTFFQNAQTICRS